MVLFPVFFLADAVFAVLFIREGYPQSTKKGFAFKMIASAIFVANGLYAYFQSGKNAYGLTVLLALLLGFVGDIFLTFDPFLKDKSNKKLSTFFVVLGGVFFLAGHICYLLAFLRLLKASGTFRLPTFLCALCAVPVVFAVVLLALKIHLKAFTVPVFLYAVAISSMFAAAVCLALHGHAGQPTLQVLLFAAPLLFIVSDASLVLKSFDQDRFGNLTMRAVNLGTYYLAQMLFGLSVLFLG